MPARLDRQTSELIPARPHPQDIRRDMATLLLQHYEIRHKAGVLASLIQTSNVISKGQTEELHLGDKTLVRQTRHAIRFFDLNGRWILTVDRLSGQVTDHFEWNDLGEYVTGWTFSPQCGKLVLTARVNAQVIGINAQYGLVRNARLVSLVGKLGYKGYDILEFIPGLNFEEMKNIPYAKVATNYVNRYDLSGVGASVMRVVAFLALDQGHVLTYAGDDTDPQNPSRDAHAPLFNTLLEASDLPSAISAPNEDIPLPENPQARVRLFLDFPTFFHWTPRPADLRIHPNGAVSYERDGQVDRL